MFDIGFSQLVGGFVGFVLSLVFEYFPRLSAWFDACEKWQKAAVMFIGNVAAAFLITWGVCDGWLFRLLPGLTVPTIECLNGGWIYEVMRVGIFALLVNQATHRMTGRGRVTAR